MKRIGRFALAATIAGLLVWLVAARGDSAGTTHESRSDAPAAEPSAPAPSRHSSELESRGSRRERERLAHEQLIAKIRQAHVAGGGNERVGPCAGPGCARVGEEIRDILDGCREQVAGTKGRVVLTADLLAAPEIGTVVDSVTLAGDGASDALRECLVESMYTLDLGEPEQAFAERVEVFFGGGIVLQLDEKSDPALIEATLQLAQYDEKADAAIRDGAYIITQGPIPSEPDD